MEATLHSYKLWLQSKHYSDSTIRNYLVDINKYLSFVKDSNAIYLPESIAAYLSSIESDSNKDRYTSSLSKFFQFSADQKLIVSNLLPKIKSDIQEPKTDLDTILEQYKAFLLKRKFSPSTIKNYLNDINQFIAWSKSNPNGAK